MAITYRTEYVHTDSLVTLDTYRMTPLDRFFGLTGRLISSRVVWREYAPIGEGFRIIEEQVARYGA